MSSAGYKQSENNEPHYVVEIRPARREKFCVKHNYLVILNPQGRSRWVNPLNTSTNTNAQGWANTLNPLFFQEYFLRLCRIASLGLH